jgi:parallel beta-helix repeat protein
MKPTLFRVLVAAGAVLLGGTTTARADETTFCNFYITTLPYTAATQGHHCFDRNLSTAITTGNAITVNSDFVTIDLNNFKLGGGSAGPATDAIGIYSNNHSNLTVRNGNIRGFAMGIMVEGATTSTAQNTLIENNVLDGNLKVGVAVYGKATTIRNNTVSNTGGSTSTNPFCVTGARVVGIVDRSSLCLQSTGSIEVLDNTVLNTFPPADPGFPNAWAISVTGRSIVSFNRVIGVTGGQVAIVGLVCRDNTVLDSVPLAYACSFMVGTNSDH